MQNILIIGELAGVQIQALLRAVQQLPAVNLTVLTDSAHRADWPTTTNVIIADWNDPVSLTTAMVGQDVVFSQLATVTKTGPLTALLTAGRRGRIGRLVLASDTSVLTLTQHPVHWYQQRRQRRLIHQLRSAEQQLRQSGLDFTWIQGRTANDTAIYSQALALDWTTAVPTRRSLLLADYLSVGGGRLLAA